MASSVIGSLDIRLAVITAPLVKGLKQAQGELASFAKAATSPFTALAAAAGAGVSVAALKSYVGAAMESIDVTAKVSDRLGVATEALTQLQYAAHLAGVGSEDFNNGLEKLQRNIGAAAMGSESQAEAFARLGLNAQELANAGTTEAFLQISDAIQDINNPAERAAAAFDVFGKSGQKLLNTLMLGREGLAATGEKADQMGLSFSRIDAAQVEAAGDSLGDVGKLLSGISNQVAIQLAPFITELSSRFVNAATSGETMGLKVAAALESGVKGVALFADAIASIPLLWKQAQIAGTGFVAGVAEAIAGASMWVTEQTGLGANIKPEDDPATQLFKWSQDLQKQNEQVRKSLEESLAAPSAGEKITAFFDELRSKSLEAATAVAETNQQMGMFDDSFERLLREQERTAKTSAPRQLGTTGAAVRGSAEAFSSINRSLTKPGEETAKNTAKANAILTNMKDTLRKIDASLAATNTASIA